jgi:hypothetical protein
MASASRESVFGGLGNRDLTRHHGQHDLRRVSTGTGSLDLLKIVFPVTVSS